MNFTPILPSITNKLQLKKKWGAYPSKDFWVENQPHRFLASQYPCVPHTSDKSGKSEVLTIKLQRGVGSRALS